MPNPEEDTERRTKFYSSADVTRLISKEGIPKSKRAMTALISKGAFGGSEVDPGSFECLSNVVFAVHPQQINVRDKSNGKVIAIILR